MANDYVSAEEKNKFYAWDELAERWIKKEDTFDQDFPPKPHDPEDSESLAEHIIETVFELILDEDDKQWGSYLPGYDVVNRDAYQMIQLSIATEMANHIEPLFLECYADENGIVKFYPIGTTISDVKRKNQVLYSISTGALKQKCENVIITGYNPPPKRFTRDFENKPLDLLKWATNFDADYDLWDTKKYVDLYGKSFEQVEPNILTKSDNYIYNNISRDDFPKYWVVGDIMGPSGFCDYYREGYIEYLNPKLTDERFLEAKGIFSKYKFEKIIGHMYKVEVPWFIQGSTTMEFRNTSPRYIQLPGFGKLQQRVWKDQTTYKPAICSVGQEVDADVGMYLPGSDSPKFLGVSSVIIYGFELKEIAIDEAYRKVGEDTYAREKGPADFIVAADTMLNEPFTLTQGQDYLVVKDTSNDEGGWKIVFSCNVSSNYVNLFGGYFDDTDTENIRRSKIRVAKASLYEKSSDALPISDDFFDNDLSSPVTGYLRDGITKISSSDVFDVMIFPMGEGNSGYAIRNYNSTDNEGDHFRGKIIVVYEWDNPSVRFTDLDNNVKLENLQKVTIGDYPIINKDVPAPQVHITNGETRVLDPRLNITDLDPATVQNLSTNDYQRAFSSLENGDINLTLPFLSADFVGTEDPSSQLWSDNSIGSLTSIANYIYDLQNEVVENTTYTCDANALPILGQVIDNKTINSITYSYQDSSQYLVSVQAGPAWHGISGWNTSLYQNQTESVQLEGVIKEVANDNTKANVMVDRLGLMECINGQMDILEVGDTVKLTVYNNPVSI